VRGDIVHDDGTLRQVICRNVHVCVWLATPTAAHVHAHGAVAARVAARHGGRSALMNLAVAGVPRFSQELRDAVAEHTNEGLHRLGAAHVILVRGLRGVAVRGLLGTAILVGRPPNPTRVFRDLPSAASWQAQNLAAYPAEPWTTEELIALCRSAIWR
jgi:hypothetical protein